MLVQLHLVALMIVAPKSEELIVATLIFSGLAMTLGLLFHVILYV